MSDKAARIAKVGKNHLDKKYNCAQAVACVYAPMFGIEDEAVTFRAMEAFGGGMAIKETCGVISAMAYIAGLAKSDGNMEAPASKQETYEILRNMMDEFVKKNQSMICKEIKGLETGVALASCPQCMLDAAAIIEQYIIEGNDEHKAV